MMRTLYRRSLILLLTTGILAACTEAPGRFRVEFTFEEPEPDAEALGALWLHVQVEERGDPNAAGDVLASAVEPMTVNPTVTLDAVRHGEDRVVVAEIRGGEHPSNSPLEYFGLSETFSLAPGDDKTIPVRLRLNHPPGDGRADFLEILGTRGGLINHKDATIRIEDDDVNELLLAKDPQFTVGRAMFKASSLTPNAPSGVPRYEVVYDLEDGLCSSSPCDIPVTVYGRIVNAQGIVSKTATASVTLDRTAPRVVETSVVLSVRSGNTNLPASDVRALGRGGSATLVFSVSELLASPPRVEAHVGDEVLPFVRISDDDPNERTYTFSLTIDEMTSTSSAVAEIRVGLEDIVGNVASQRMPNDLPIDTAAPAAPDVETDGRIVFIRAPWGDLSDSSSRFELVGDDGAAEPYSTLRVFHPATGEVKRIPVDSRGGFSATVLPMPDTTDLFVDAVDRAGNASVSVRVRDGRWRAGLGGKRSGNSGRNPHRIDRVRAVREHLALASAELPDVDYDRIEIGSSVASRAVQNWVQLTVDPIDLTNRADSAAVYDEARGLTLVFGGIRSGLGVPVLLEDTWVSDGRTWTLLPPQSIAPSPRYHAAMAYDSRRGRTVLFGGTEDDGIFGSKVYGVDETWEWNGSTWVRRDPMTAPMARIEHGMAYDRERGSVVLFGGRLDDATASDETWSYDGNDWRLHTPTTSPPADYEVAMAYNDAENLLFLVGGHHARCTGSRDTWVFDGTDWTRLQNTHDPPISATALAFDRARNQMMMVGGRIDTTDCGTEPEAPIASNGVWVWSPLQQRWVAEAGPTPAARYGHSLVYAAGTRDVRLIGGRVTEGDRPGTFLEHNWRFDDEGWTRAPNDRDTQPTGRSDSMSVRIPGRDGLLMITGEALNLSPVSYEIKLDSWDFAEQTWTSTTVPEGLCPRTGGRTAYDTLRDRAYFFGGDTFAFLCPGPPFDGTTIQPPVMWSLGTDTEWTDHPVGGPEGRKLHGMTYDPKQDVVAVYGGSIFDPSSPPNLFWDDSEEFWLFHPATGVWEEVTTSTSPGPRSALMMGYDPVTEKILVAGGARQIFGSNGSVVRQKNLGLDTRVYDSVSRTWSAAIPGPAGSDIVPPGAQMVLDHDRNRLVVFGGATIWEWDGTQWLSVNTVTRPPFREYHTLAYAGPGLGLMVFGGKAGNVRDDTWLLERANDVHPGFIATFDWGNALVDTENIDEIELVISAGSSGPSGDATGVDVSYWRFVSGHWTPFATNDASAESPGVVASAIIANPQDAISPDGELHVLIRGKAGVVLAEDAARTALERIEAHVRYRLR
jgi:hypothetical protein